MSEVPDTELMKSPLWKSFTLKDAVYAIVLAVMLLNQHFNTEERMSKLEDSNAQVIETLKGLSKKIDTDLVPRKEYTSGQQALQLQLGNLEAGQNNILTYMLNHGR